MSTRTSAERRAALAVLPAVLLVVLVLGAGLGSAVAQSLGLLPVAGPARLSASGYRHQDLPLATGLSLLIATASTVVAAVVGLTTALLVVGSRRARRVLSVMVVSSVPVPHLVGAVSLGLLLADGGLLSRWLGVPAPDWPPLVAGRWPTAVVLEYAWKESAFVALVVATSLATRLVDYRETATLLGAGPLARLRHVALPLAAPSLVAASAIAFVYTLGSYEVAWLLGAAYPEPLPVMSYRLFTSTDLAARPAATATAVVTVAVAGAAALTALAALRRAAWR